MRFHDWINNIRWKYFTNNKSGLIFKELTKEFGMVVVMTENKRYVQFEFPYDDFAVKDNQTNEELWNPKVVDRLNEQDERILELEKDVLDLRAEVGRLNSKKEIEKPHWLKYKSSKGYTKKVNQDIRFNADVE